MVYLLHKVALPGMTLSLFLQAYDEVSSCLQFSKDYRDITYDYLKSCALEGTIYAETFISPDHAAEMGMSYEDVLSGCVQGIDDAEREFGHYRTYYRHLCPSSRSPAGDKNCTNSWLMRPHPYIVGFGMGGDESQYVASDFTPAFSNRHRCWLSLYCSCGRNMWFRKCMGCN